MAFYSKYFGAWKWTTKLMQMLQFYESTIMMSMENIDSLEITVNCQIYEFAPPHAYKLSMLFWSTTLAYSSRNFIVGTSFISPAWKEKRSNMKFIIYIYLKQSFKVVEGVLKPEKFGAARYQLMLQLNTHCTLPSHPKLFA